LIPATGSRGLEIADIEDPPLTTRNSEDQRQTITRTLEVGNANLVPSAFEPDGRASNLWRMLAIIINDRSPVDV
jgi:hypothetical protein